MRLIDADELKKCAIPCQIHNGALTDLCVPVYQIDNAPTEPQVTVFAENASKEEIEDFKQELENVLERPKGEWIPVSERLPEQANQAYLVTIDYGDGVAFSCQRFFFGKGIGWNDSGVLAWMPLPEPYKKGGAE